MTRKTAQDRFYEEREIELLCQDFDYFGVANREVNGRPIVVLPQEGQKVLVRTERDSAICERDSLPATVRRFSWKGA